MKSKLWVFGLVLAAAAGSMADAYTFTNNTGNAWETVANWTVVVGSVTNPATQLPGAVDTAALNAGSGGTITCVLTAPATIAGLNMKNKVDFTINANVTVNGEFTAGYSMTQVDSTAKISSLTIGTGATLDLSSSYKSGTASSSDKNGTSQHIVSLLNNATLHTAANFEYTSAQLGSAPNQLNLSNGSKLNVGGNFVITDTNPDETVVSFKDWRATITAASATVAGSLNLTQDGGYAGNSTAQFPLIHVTGGAALGGSFNNITFGSTTVTNAGNYVYEVDMAALDPDQIQNDVVLNLVSVPELPSVGLYIIK